MNENTITNGVFFRSTIFNFTVSMIVFLSTFYVDKSNHVFIYEYFIGAIIMYFNDIVFIQRLFTVKDKLKLVDYMDFGFRLKYTLNLNHFSKFIVVFIIQTLLVQQMVHVILKMLERYNLLQTPPKLIYNDITNDDTVKRYKTHLNILTHIVVKMVFDIVLLSFLKFKWAYINVTNELFTLIVSTFMVLSLLIISSNFK